MPTLRVDPLKEWSLRWWQLAHQTTLREPPVHDPIFLARLHQDQRTSEVVFGAASLVILGSNPLLALAAAAHCASFVPSMVVAVARNADHWNYPMVTTPLFRRFVHRFAGGQAPASTEHMAQTWANAIPNSCAAGWVDLTGQDWFHLSRDEPSGLMLGMWGPAQDDQDPWHRPEEAPRPSTREAYDEVWNACVPALDRLGRLPFPKNPVVCEGPDRPANVLASQRVLLVSSLPRRVSQTVRTTDDGQVLQNEWGLPAVGSAAFVSTSARGHFEAPLKDLETLKSLDERTFPARGRWPDTL